MKKILFIAVAVATLASCKKDAATICPKYDHSSVSVIRSGDSIIISHAQTDFYPLADTRVTFYYHGTSNTFTGTNEITWNNSNGVINDMRVGFYDIEGKPSGQLYNVDRVDIYYHYAQRCGGSFPTGTDNVSVTF